MHAKSASLSGAACHVCQLSCGYPPGSGHWHLACRPGDVRTLRHLEDIHSGALVSGIVPNTAVEAVSVEWIGDQAINLVFRVPGGLVSETTLYRDDEHRLGIEQGGRAWSFDADGGLLRLVTEANRIKLAHYFDPYLAIHTSLVDPLPHQIIVAPSGKLSSWYRQVVLQHLQPLLPGAAVRNSSFSGCIGPLNLSR